MNISFFLFEAMNPTNLYRTYALECKITYNGRCYQIYILDN